MKNRFLFIPLILLILPFLVVNELNAQKAAKDKSETKTQTKADSTKKKVTIADKVKGSNKIEGLFTLYQDTTSGKLQMIIKKDQLEAEFIYQSFSMGGPPSLFLNQNMLRETWVFSIQKVYDKIHFSKENTNFYFEPGKAISKSANADVSTSKFFSSKIIAKDSTSYLIAVDKLFMGTLLDQIKPVIPAAMRKANPFNIGKINNDKSYYKEIRSFPENIDVVVSLSFDNPAPANRGGKDITDARYIDVKMQHSFIAMPENDFKPRFDDPRVGYFMQQKENMSASKAPFTHDMINRWHIKKKDPNADISEAVKPVTWWVENTTPLEYRQLIVDAGHKWNEAFEKAGFKNAVVMKIMPDDADWDPSDIRYNVIRWVSSDLGFAIGPSFVNPRTGEILGADITIDLGMLRHTLNEEEIASLAFEAHDYNESDQSNAYADHKNCSIAHGKKMQYSMASSMLELYPNADQELKTLKEQFITELVLHEMGHTFGLGHNMKASHMLSPEELHDKSITRKLGLTSSIMDYTIVNIHSDRNKQGDYYSVKTGPYDWWAIEYGYTEFKEGEEEEGLKAILSKSVDPKLDYGNDSDIVRGGTGIDPRVQVWDQSNDLVSYAEDRFKFVNQSMSKLDDKFVSDDKSYQEYFNKFYYLLRERSSLSRALSAYIGGIYVNRNYHGQEDGKMPFTPVPESYQRSVMSLLADGVLAPNAFDADKAVYPYLQRQRRGWNFGGKTEDPKIQNYVLGLHAGIINFILHPVTMARINSSELYGNTYSVSEVLQDLVNASFDADISNNVNLFRQNLQKELVKKLILIDENKARAYDNASNSAAFYALKELTKDLKKNVKKGNLQSKAHKTSMLFTLEEHFNTDH